MRTVKRAFLTFGLILSFLLQGVALEIWMAAFRAEGPSRQRARARSASRHARAMLRALGFQVHVRGAPPRGRGRGRLIVSNHLSFWDVLFLSSLLEPVYVTSVEVRETPVLGLLTRIAGCVFVERRDRSRARGEASGIALQLRAGVDVVLFPEGTTGNGEHVLPFKRSMFRAAVEAGTLTCPVRIQYRLIDGAPVTTANRDSLFYYGDHSFACQLVQVFSLNSVEVEVAFLEALPASPDHGSLAERSHAQVRAAYVSLAGAPPAQELRP